MCRAAERPAFICLYLFNKSFSLVHKLNLQAGSSKAVASQCEGLGQLGSVYIDVLYRVARLQQGEELPCWHSFHDSVTRRQPVPSLVPEAGVKVGHLLAYCPLHAGQPAGHVSGWSGGSDWSVHFVVGGWYRIWPQQALLSMLCYAKFRMRCCGAVAA